MYQMVKSQRDMKIEIVFVQKKSKLCETMRVNSDKVLFYKHINNGLPNLESVRVPTNDV